MDRPRKFSDILYTQKYVYPNFSNGKISIAETYVALAIGLLDPGSLPPMVIFQHDNEQWCRDTRRLTIARALEQNDHHEVLEAIQVINAKKTDKLYEKQYTNLINERLPTMKKQKLYGKTVVVSTKKGSTCCFDSASNLFRNNVIEHVAKDHLEMTVDELHNLNSYYCDKCNKKTRLQLKRSGSKKQRKYYRIMRECECNDQGHKIDIPWQQVNLAIICTELIKYKANRC